MVGLLWAWLLLRLRTWLVGPMVMILAGLQQGQEWLLMHRRVVLVQQLFDHCRWVHLWLVPKC